MPPSPSQRSQIDSESPRLPPDSIQIDLKRSQIPDCVNISAASAINSEQTAR